MMFTFSNEYILKSMWEMVRDEGNRIVSLGLATHDDLKKIIKPAVKEANDSDISGDDVLLKALAKLYTDFKSVCLQGDLEKLAEEPEWKHLLDLECEEDNLDEEPQAMEPDLGDVDEKTEEREEELASPEQGLVTIYSALEEMVYKFGTSGDHEGAYNIERIIRGIERVASSLDEEDIKKMAAEILEALGEEV